MVLRSSRGDHKVGEQVAIGRNKGFVTVYSAPRLIAAGLYIYDTEPPRNPKPPPKKSWWRRMLDRVRSWFG